MGGKVSTSSGTGSAISSGITRSDSRNAGVVNSDSVAGLLRSASQGGSAINGPTNSVNGTNGSTRDRGRTRSLSGMAGNNNGTAMSIPVLLSRSNAGLGAQPLSALMGGSDTAGSTPDDIDLHGPFSSLGLGRVMVTYSLPPHMRPLNGFKCPVCSKMVPYDETECHLVMCLTKPRLVYNEDVISEDKGECVICLEDLLQGDTIARLPCLCIYHKTCIEKWFQVNRICPEHPYD